MKENRATWLGKMGRDLCAVCYLEDMPRDVAKKCDGVHFHKYCGSQIVVKRGKLTCGQRHSPATILTFATKTKKEALPPGETRLW